MHKAAMTLLCCALLGVALTGPVFASSDPYAIFSDARQFFLAQHYPAYIDYDVAVSVVESGKERTEHYASAYNATNGEIWVDPLSDYEIAHPASGRGVGFCFEGCPPGPQPDPGEDFLGVPLLSPTFAFTIAPFIAMPPPGAPTDAQIVSDVRKAFHDPNPRRVRPPSASPSPESEGGLREIAAVSARKREYAITLAGVGLLDGRSCYHLVLVPLHRDGRYRLRELWIDEATFATIRAKIALNFVDGPGTTVPWRIDFAAVGDSWYVARESADSSVRYASKKYSSVNISFERIRPRETEVTSRQLPFSAFLVLREP